MNQRLAYRSGIAVALLACLLIAWTTVVRDDDNGLAYLSPILAAAVGAAATQLNAAGMARAMAAIAVMQLLTGVAIATAPSVSALPHGSERALVGSGVYAALWLASAGYFWRSAG